MRIKNQKGKNIHLNAVMAVIQVVLSSAMLFILYKYLLTAIGVKDLGIWSVVLATTSTASISGFGFSGSVTKFVAKYLARESHQNVSEVIQTAFVSIGLFSGALLLFIYPLGEFIFRLVIHSQSIEKAISIFPYAVISFWAMMVTGIFQSGLDGCQRIDLRSVLVISSTLLHLIIVFFIVPSYGLMGLAYARVWQAGATLCMAWLMLRYVIPFLPVFPYKWNVKLFREMLGYGVNFQITSISQMLCDPVTKALLSRFGGLEFVGFYEMASRMLLQFRMLFVSANQVLVPKIADIEEKEPTAVQRFYIASYRLMLYLALPSFSLLIVAAPLISELLIGEFESKFVIVSVLLGISLLINTLSSPAYFTYLGTGDLKWNTLSHVATALLNLTLGFVFGYIMGGWGVVFGWVLSSIIGSVSIVISLHVLYKLTFCEFLPSESYFLSISCLTGLLCAISVCYILYYIGQPYLAGYVALFVFVVAIIYPIMINPQIMLMKKIVYLFKRR